MADTAALVVALSAQLTKFEKDMKGAVDIANKRTKEIEQSFAKMNVGIQNQLSALAANFGGAGGVFSGAATAIKSLGPLGAAGATSVLALGAAFALVSTEVEKYAKKVDQLINASETLGISITALNELGRVGLEVGVSAETVEQSIGKMTVAVDQLRDGAGPLVETLRKINPQLQLQVANARSTSEAIDILARAFSDLGSEFEKNAFLRAVFGRGGLPFGRVLEQVAQRGGLKAMEEQAKATGKAIDENIAREIDNLVDKIQLIKDETTNMWAEAFGPTVLSGALTLVEYWNAISRAVTEVFKEIKRGDAPRLLRAPVKPVEFGGDLPAAREKTDIEKRQETSEIIGLRIKNLKDEIAAAGEAVTANQKYRLELLEVQKAQNDGLLSQEKATERLNRFELAVVSSTLALKERVGIISEEEFIQRRLIDFYRDAATAQLDYAERLKAVAQIRKEALRDFQEFKIKQSDLPQLARLAKEGTDLKQQFDRLAVDTFSNFENAIADVATSASTLEEAFKKMADSIIRDLIRITIRMAITAPIAKALNSALGGFGGIPLGETGNPFAKMASGGPVRAGEPYIVGEKGPELFVPKGAGTIVPSALSGRGGMSAPPIEINNYVAADTETKQSTQQGPDGERIVIDIVRKAQARGEFDSVNRARFGLRANKVR